MRKHDSRPFLAAGAILAVMVLAVLACCGCGTRQYQERMNASLQNLQQASAFNQLLYDPTPLAETRVLIRVPKVFQQSFVEGSVIDGQPVNRLRVAIPTLDLPALSITYEAMVPLEKAQVAYYCYLGVAVPPAGPQPIEPTYALQDVQFPAPHGGDIAWKKLRCTGPQEFYCVEEGGKGTFRKMPGTVEIYTHQEGGYLVVMGWRVPTAAEQSTDFSKLAALMAGSLVVQPKK
jgi:hypothetical protein